MTRDNHALSGMLLIEAYLAYTGYLWHLRLLLNPDTIIIAAPTMVAIFLGALFPDIDVRIPPDLKFHRTIFHWPYLYITIILIAFFLLSWAPGLIDIVVGFCIGSLVHIAMDYHTVAGVPFGFNPFGKKSSSKFMRYNSFKEILVTCVLIGMALCIFWVPLIVSKALEIVQKFRA